MEGDVERAMTLIHEVARENERVLEDPPPVVHFEQSADSSLNLSLRAYVASLSDRLPTITELHNAIDQRLRKGGIVIAFPQRDVHLFRADPAPPAAEPAESWRRAVPEASRHRHPHRSLLRQNIQLEELDGGSTRS